MTRLVGIDEVGRGPLAGPVAVCVAMWHSELPIGEQFEHLRDSKKATKKMREAVFERARELREAGALEYVVGFCSAQDIDAYGIAPSIRTIIAGALKKMAVPFDAAIKLDGGLIAPSEYIHQEAVVRGDDSEPLIALASNIAKVVRDRRMEELAKTYPVYGFEKHAGYGTKAHIEAIKLHGPSPEHRRSFLGNIL